MRLYGQPRRRAKPHFLSGRRGPFTTAVHWGVNVSSCHTLQALRDLDFPACVWGGKEIQFKSMF